MKDCTCPRCGICHSQCRFRNFLEIRLHANTGARTSVTPVSLGCQDFRSRALQAVFLRWEAEEVESSHLITLSAEPPSENLQCVEIIFRHTDARRRVHRGKSIIGERKLLSDLCQKLAWTEWFRYIVGTSCFPCDDVISA
jgi:hypothetical protein